MEYELAALIDPAGLAAAKRDLGSALPRIVSYYRHDGIRSITAIEDAMTCRNPAAMVLPAHSLKGESRQLGAYRLGELAYYLETTARTRMENRQPLPDDLAVDVARLRSYFHETVGMLERDVAVAATPVAAAVSTAPIRRPTFGKRVSH